MIDVVQNSKFITEKKSKKLIEKLTTTVSEDGTLDNNKPSMKFPLIHRLIQQMMKKLVRMAKILTEKLPMRVT